MALIDNLVSYYKLDETSGTTATDSHGSNNGTNNGATINVAGKIDKAYDFDGTNDYVSLSSTGITGSFSIGAWVNPDSLASTGKIFEDRATFALDVTSSGIGVLGTTNTFKGLGSYGTPVSTGVWTYVLATYDGSNLKIYVNGDLKSTNAVTGGGVVSTSGNTRIGSAQGGGQYWNGKIDEVGIWSRALSSTEVSELYNSGNGFAYPFVTDTTVNVSAALTLSTDDAEPTININVPIITFEQGLTLQYSTFNIIRGVSGTVGTAEISKHYPIEENRTWETVQYLVPDVDLTIRKNRIGLGNC